jgi:diaminopropionate ammonia-lyase family
MRAMIYANPGAQRVPYPAALREILSIERARECRRWLSGWAMLNPLPTPMRRLPGLAAQLALGQVYVKDESIRSPLGSFKVLGAPAALQRLVAERVPDAQPEGILSGRYAAFLEDFVVITATDGNHGRALAAAARSAGCRCVIVLHAHVSPEREAPIAALGAQIVRIEGNYDDSVREAARLAAEHGWQVVSDTSYEGYEAIPRDVMQGYGVIADEVLEQSPRNAARPFTHVVVQGGVGGLAAGLVSYFWERYGSRRPCFIVVEPQQADCLLQSARSGRPERASGSVDSVMAGLACGEASPLAWRFLQPAVEHFMAVTDAQAIEAMRVLARGVDGDVPVLAGESGAAGVAALMALYESGEARGLGLHEDARVLLVNTEGATAPALYESLVGISPAEVLRNQEMCDGS